MSDAYPAKTWFQQQAVAEGFERGRFSGFRGRLIHRLEERAFLKALAVAKDSKRVLDVPCGTGRFMSLLLRGNYQVHGADISLPMLQQAMHLRTIYGPVSLSRSDAESLPFRNDSFDCVVCVRLMGHLPHQIRIGVLRQMRRVTRRFIVVNYFLVNSLYARRRLRWHAFQGNLPAAWYPCSDADLRQELIESGLNLVASFPIAGPLSESHMLVLTPTAA
jgi:ubiquinone/menaquinone biosynthesis C-methylase UbiE